MEVLVPKIKFEEMASKVCCQQLTEGYIPNTVFFSGIEYVITGSMGNASDRMLFAHQIVLLNKYKGELKPLEYSRHFLAVDLGERDRCYNGMLVRKGKQMVVIIGKEVDFKVSQEGTQISLF